MAWFSKKPWNTADEAVSQRDSANEARKASAAARAVGAAKLADKARRSAATSNVVARYFETGRCQFGHRNCMATDH